MRIKQTIKQVVMSHLWYMLRDLNETGIEVESGTFNDSKRFFSYKGKRYVIEMRQVK